MRQGAQFFADLSGNLYGLFGLWLRHVDVSGLRSPRLLCEYSSGFWHCFFAFNAARKREVPWGAGLKTPSTHPQLKFEAESGSLVAHDRKKLHGRLVAEGHPA